VDSADFGCLPTVCVGRISVVRSSEGLSSCSDDSGSVSFADGAKCNRSSSIDAELNF